MKKLLLTLSLLSCLSSQASIMHTWDICKVIDRALETYVAGDYEQSKHIIRGNDIDLSDAEQDYFLANESFLSTWQGLRDAFKVDDQHAIKEHLIAYILWHIQEDIDGANSTAVTSLLEKLQHLGPLSEETMKKLETRYHYALQAEKRHAIDWLSAMLGTFSLASFVITLAKREGGWMLATPVVLGLATMKSISLNKQIRNEAHQITTLLKEFITPLEEQ